MQFKVAVAQFASHKAQLARNLDRIAEISTQAESEGAALVVFPESATTGYFVEGGVTELALTAEALAQELADRLRPKGLLDLVLGFYEERAGLLYNSAAYLEAGPAGVRVVHVYQKFFLPTYGVFDEERFVTSGDHLAVFPTRLGKVALLICEDIWHSIMPTLCAIHGAEILLVPSASPGRGFSGAEPSNLERYERLLRGIAEEHALFIVNSQLTGFEGGKGFAGGSAVIGPSGEVLARSPILDEHLLITEVDSDLLGNARAHSPLLADLRTRWSRIRNLIDQGP